jgi:Mrp family chromosome partitioning ATPase
MVSIIQDADVRLSRELERVASRWFPFRKTDLYANGLTSDRRVLEESERLVQNVFLLKRDSALRTVVFAGVDHGAGCSEICARAAEILAGSVSGLVCLVDANIRSPYLKNFYDVEDPDGLTDALVGDGGIFKYVKQVDDSNLWLLPAGSLTGLSPTVLGSSQMRTRLAELRNEFEYVILDAPPLSAYSDTVVLGQMADGLIMIVEANATRRATAMKVTETLRSNRVSVLGAVLNKRTYPIPSKLYKML